MDNVRVVTMPLPGKFRAFTVKKDDYYTIVMRDDLSAASRVKAYAHELEHIKNGDYDSRKSADLIEVFAHF